MPNQHKIMFLVFLATVGPSIYLMFQDRDPMSDESPSLLSSLMSALVVDVELGASDEDILYGHRRFDADIQHNSLSFHGAAFTFLNQDDPSTFTPYNFAYDGEGFVEMPDSNLAKSFYELYDADFPTTSGVDIESCIRPDRGSIAAEEGMTLVFPALCRIDSTLSGGSSGMIGIIFSANNKQPITDGDATCRSEIGHWRTLPGFTDMPVVLCAIVDRPYDANAPSANYWMDVIFYQQYGRKLFNMRGERRNFQRVY